MQPAQIPGGRTTATPLQPSQASTDYWDPPDSAVGLAAMPPDHEFSELVEVDYGSKPGRTVIYLLTAIFAVAGGYVAWEVFINERNPLDQITTLISGSPSEPEPTMPMRNQARKKGPVKKEIAAAPTKAAPSGVLPVAGNPYWTLPNRILGPDAVANRLWTPEEEETLRAGLLHKFAFQRYKTVQDVRALRLKGSEVVLWDALQDKKFWTRMYSVFGLAEFNTEVSLQTIEGAMAGARSELIADFFERFTRRPDAAHLFVLRQAVRVLDEKGRMVVLRGINRSRDNLRDLYMVAATQDPGRRVQKWVRQALSERPVRPDRYNQLIEVVKGRVDGTYLLTGAPPPSRARVTKQASDAEIEKSLVNGDEDFGNVEIYEGEENPEPASELPDPETYEYTLDE